MIKTTEKVHPDKHREKVLNRIFLAFIVAVTIIAYSNTIGNYYSLDDYHISTSNTLISKGFEGIPKILTSLYATGEQDDLSYGYRPLVRISFALEYGIFGKDNPRMPYISHSINLLLYLLLVILLYSILKRLFRNQSLYFPFFITLLFIAHPVHTEVVASLKNRDEILSLGFFLLSLRSFLKYADHDTKWSIFWGVFFYILAFLSKVSIVSTVLLFPLVFYFFTDMKPRKIWIFSIVLFFVALFTIFLPYLYLPETSRDMRFFENPIPFEDSFTDRIATGMYGLYYYLRLLIYPHPLVYYYGYNMIPITGPGNPLVILSFLAYLGMLVIAILTFRKKNILSFAIMFYLITIFPFSNFLAYTPGIIGERFLFLPSLGFIIALVYLLFMLFRKAGKKFTGFDIRTAIISLIVLALLIPYLVKTRDRNKDWNTKFTLYSNDIKYLDNSVKANDLMAHELMKQVNRELSKPVDVTKFIKPTAERAMNYWKRAVEIYPGHYSSWTNLGIAYNKIYKEYDKSIAAFKKALDIKPDHGIALFNLGLAYENKGLRDSAMVMYEKCIEIDPDIINPRSRLANLHFLQGDFNKALSLNEEILRIDPNEPLPFLNFGNYYLRVGDTIKGIEFYERAVAMGAPPQVSLFLSRFFQQEGNEDKATYYHDRFMNASRQEQEMP